MSRSDLRAQALDLDGPGCSWPSCESPAEHMAHIHGIGMGGRKSADTLENVAMLCRWHHDILDGRREGRRFEMGELLRGYMKIKRSMLGYRSAHEEDNDENLGRASDA